MIDYLKKQFIREVVPNILSSGEKALKYSFISKVVIPKELNSYFDIEIFKFRRTSALFKIGDFEDGFLYDTIDESFYGELNGIKCYVSSEKVSSFKKGEGYEEGISIIIYCLKKDFVALKSIIFTHLESKINKLNLGVPIFNYDRSLISVKPKRSWESIEYEGSFKEKLIKIIDDWANTEPVEGQTSNLGLLFSGPPGSGKTSLAVCIATHLGVGIYNMENDYIYESTNWTLIPPKSVVLYDECNSLFAPRTNNSAALVAKNLAAIDGVKSSERLIRVFTTNNPDALDVALFRQGRVDYHIKLPYRSKTGASKVIEVEGEETPSEINQKIKELYK